MMPGVAGAGHLEQGPGEPSARSSWPKPSRNGALWDEQPDMTQNHNMTTNTATTSQSAPGTTSPTAECVSPSWRQRWRRGAPNCALLLATVIVGQAAAADLTATLLGKWPGHLRGAVHSIAVDQGFAYVGLSNSGLKILDVSDPAAPRFVSDLDLGGATDGLAVSGTLIYLSNVEHGLQVIDAADRANPELVATLQTAPAIRPVEHFTYTGRNVAVSDHHVFIADGALGFRIFDVSVPAQPRLVGRLDLPGTEGVEAVAVAISGDHAYLACGYGGLWVIDISDPETPRQVATFPPSEDGLFVRHVAVSGNVAFFTDQRNLVVLDVSDPGDPKHLASMIDDFTDNLAVSGTTACVRTRDGAQFVDVTDPSMPRLQGVAAEVIGNIILDDGHMLAADGRGLTIVDTSDPENPGRAGGFTTAGEASRLKVLNGYAYVTGGAESGLDVVNIRNAAEPESVAQITPAFAHDLAVSGNHVYVPSRGIQVVDISQPRQPRHVGEVNGLFPMRIAASTSALYALLPPIGQMSLAVLKLDDPALPAFAGSTPLQGVPFFTDLATHESFVYLITTGQMWVIDASDPSHPRRGHVEFAPASFTGITVHGNHAYIAAFQDGLWIYDLSDPARPQRAGNLPLSGQVRTVAASGDHAYVLSDENQLHFVNVSDPSTPWLVGQAPVQSGHLQVSQGRIFIGAGSRGLRIYSDPLAITFAPSPRWEPGGFRMTLRGPPGGAFEIQRTGDFQNWATWIEGVFGDTDTGGLEFFDEAAGSNPFQFYRARQR